MVSADNGWAKIIFCLIRYCDLLGKYMLCVLREEMDKEWMEKTTIVQIIKKWVSLGGYADKNPPQENCLKVERVGVVNDCEVYEISALVCNEMKWRDDAWFNSSLVSVIRISRCCQLPWPKGLIGEVVNKALVIFVRRYLHLESKDLEKSFSIGTLCSLHQADVILDKRELSHRFVHVDT